MGVGGISLSGLDIHDAEGEPARRNRLPIEVLAGAARTDESMLGALVSFYFRVLERVPVRFSVLESGNIALGNLFQSQTSHFGRSRVSRLVHGRPPEMLQIRENLS